MRRLSWSQAGLEGAGTPFACEGATLDAARRIAENYAAMDEMEELRAFLTLARSIVKNSKGEVLLTALRRGFTAAADAQRAQHSAVLQHKALIFTESRRTQEYLFQLLEHTEFTGKVMRKRVKVGGEDPEVKG